MIQPLENGYQLDEKFQKLLIANPIFAQMVNELIEYGIENYKEIIRILTKILISNCIRSIRMRMCAGY